MKNMNNMTVDYLRKNNLIIFEGISGSKAYGTDLPNSDTDIRGIFMQPLDDILKYGFIDQISDEKNDIVFYELGRFMELLQKNNPNILEIINLPKDCIIFQDDIFYQILNNAEKFISKKCRLTFAGYAIDQIKKARGYNKKINWEEKEMVRKGVLDFCYVLKDAGSISLSNWIDYLPHSTHLELESVFTYKNFGLSKVDHAHDIYAMYLMQPGDFSGVVSDPEKANDVQLVSVPKGRELMGYLTFNKDAYSTHCKRYKEYQQWIKNRNKNRFKMNKEHGKNYDSKNMLHTYRLLSMALEIADGKIIVRRSNDEIEKLMKIRHGEYEYDDLIKEAEAMIKALDEAFDTSKLPNEVDLEFTRNLLFKMRNMRYFSSIPLTI